VLSQARTTKPVSIPQRKGRQPSDVRCKSFAPRGGLCRDGLSIGGKLGDIRSLRAACLLFYLINLCFPTFSGVQPKSSVFIIDRMPCQLAAFFDLSLEENFFVQHGLVKRRPSPPRRPRRFGSYKSRAPPRLSLRDAETIKLNCVPARANPRAANRNIWSVATWSRPPAGGSPRSAMASFLAATFSRPLQFSPVPIRSRSIISSFRICARVLAEVRLGSVHPSALAAARVCGP